MVNGDRYPSDKEKQVYVENRLGGDAAENLQPYLSNSHPDPVGSYTQLMDHLWAQYHDPNQAEMAVLELESLRLRAGGDFQTFKNKFIRLAGETGKARREWKSSFYRKLPGDLQKALAASYIKATIDFDGLASEAAQIAMTIQHVDNVEKTTNTRNRGGRDRDKGQRNPAGNRSFDANDRRPSAAMVASKRHSSDKLRDLISQRLCINCEKPGHFAANCPEKKTQPTQVRPSYRVNALVDQLKGIETDNPPPAPASNAAKLDRVIEELDNSDSGN